ncbi:MAG: bifunctional diaminohydroxyphosphoribosylaminopyrimidine deaminase/5-amino-6-(5-phosphoribosylamino)uracil reductase RibD [Bradymonadaceae bacterium]|nr:bifunctional diaminohydroxyphosphoribosylaminopyrimidine deaminase/5-amino-6-(5-phosphoribosylamino)uracil reductase RibD [Lujinxingiaceae bacterium]
MSTQPAAKRDERFMARALELARCGLGRTRPNPAVGCVIVHGEQIVAEGFHARAGSDHAEVAALRNLSVPGSECELYVNLEPCSHFNRTPPCTNAVLASGIRRVVIGTIDTNPRVSGRGVTVLREAGIEVVCGVLEQQSRQLNAPFFKHIATGLPFVSVKYAMSLDGKIGTRSGDSAWISGEASRDHVQTLRNTYDAIMVGTTTLKKDDPRLNCRLEAGRDPMRVVLDARLESSPTSRVFDTANASTKILIFAAEGLDAERVAARRGEGVEVALVATDKRGWLDERAVLEALGQRDVLSVLVEGGGALVGSLLERRLVDRVYAFIAPRLIGGADAPSPIAGLGAATMADVIDLEQRQIALLGDDVLIWGDVPNALRDLTPRKPGSP